MIEEIRLLHYLKEDTYIKVCRKFDRLHDIPFTDMVDVDNSPIAQIHLFNLQYKSFGHIWFMRIFADFRSFNCGYEAFESTLYRVYDELFGAGIMSDFPVYDAVNCDYIEYGAIARVDDADTAIEKLRNTRLAPEQLDRDLWDSFKKASSTVAFLLCKEDDTHIRLLTKCHGTAMKRLIKDEQHHRATGISLPTAVNHETEALVLGKQIDRYISPVAEIGRIIWD
ncbi:MAG: hypothetical protein ACYC0V_13520 [Armatimonadota bacterium]